jgi:hypothetical protein
VAASSPAFSVDTGDLVELLKVVREAEADIRRETNRELRRAAGECARGIAGKLPAAAAASGVPVAPRVAASVRVKSDRLPVVSIGGPRKVGRYGAPAGALLWGSEHGPSGEINHFATSVSPTGHWIAPTVQAFKNSDAIRIYQRAVFEILRKHRLV